MVYLINIVMVLPLALLSNMEIKVYRNFKDCQYNKTVFQAKIECPDMFSFDKAVSVFKCIFPECVVLVMAL